MSTKTTNKKVTNKSDETSSPKADGSLLKAHNEPQLSGELGPIGTHMPSIIFDPMSMFHPLDLLATWLESLGDKKSGDTTYLCAITPRRIAKAVRERREIVILLPDPAYLDFIIAKTVENIINWLEVDAGFQNQFSGHAILPGLDATFEYVVIEGVKTRRKVLVEELGRKIFFQSKTRAEIFLSVVEAVRSFFHYSHLVKNLPIKYEILVCMFGLNEDIKPTIIDQRLKGASEANSILVEVLTLLDKTIVEAQSLVIQQVAHNSTLLDKQSRSNDTETLPQYESVKASRADRRRAIKAFKKKGGRNA